MANGRLTLTEARKSGRLQDFVAQEEANGIKTVDPEEFDEVLAVVIKPRQSEDQTLRSPSGGDSSGK